MTGHILKVDEMLGYRETKRRDWYCTCGQWRLHAYDNAARAAFRTHKKEA